jgi:hypothetical protein
LGCNEGAKSVLFWPMISNSTSCHALCTMNIRKLQPHV